MLTWQSIFSGQQECCSSLKRKCFLYIFFINYRLFNLFNTMRNQTSVSRHNWQRIYGVKLDEEFLSRFDVLTNLYTKNRQTMQRFRDVDEQIEKFYSENKQDDNIREWKKKLASKLSKDFEKMVHGKNCLAICGSTINGCATKYSDLDLCLCAPDGQDQYNFNRKEELSKFYDFLKNQKQAGKLTNLQFYHDAKVPVIKFRWNEPIWYYGNPYLHLDVDLIVGNPCTAWLIDLYSDYDWRFPVLCLFLKEWAKQSGVISAFQGRTLNSVSITLMLIHFLQVGTSPPVLPNIQYLMNDAGTVEDWKQKRIDCWDKILKPLRAKVPRNGNSLSQLLFAFFAYYADFDFVERMISVSNGSSLRRESDHRQSGHMIIIEEPFTEENAARAVNYEGYQLVRSKIWDAKLALFENHPLPLLPIIEQSNFWSNVGTVAAIGMTAAALLLRR